MSVLHVAFWAFVLFVALSFFGISIRAIIESPAGQENLAYLAYLAISAWHWLLGQFAEVRLPLNAS